MITLTSDSIGTIPLLSPKTGSFFKLWSKWSYQNAWKCF